MNRIGIRRESKNRWERRSPLTPEHVQRQVNDHGIGFTIQPSDLRCFTTESYKESGARIDEELNDVDLILGIKEVPISELVPNMAYMFFSHTIKGQEQNMPMLKRMKELNCTLIDYEKVVDEKGRRIIFFGWHAGVAGMIDTLWAVGRRLEWEGLRNPFVSIMKAHEYGSLPGIREHMSAVGRIITSYGMQYSIRPFVVGFAGNGNVSRGAQEMLDLLPVKEVNPKELPDLSKRKDAGKNIYKVIFNEWDLVEPVDPDRKFDLQEYYDHPDRYRSRFHEYIPYISVLMNCIYWEEKYPRLITKKDLVDIFQDFRSPRLRVIGDISCDIEGAIESTIKTTTPENPVYVYDPWENAAIPGWKGTGPVMMAVDNLPCEIPVESSEYFGDKLKEFIPQIADADLGVSFEDLKLPEPIKKAVILHQGEFTKDYAYMENFLKEM